MQDSCLNCKYCKIRDDSYLYPVVCKKGIGGGRYHSMEWFNKRIMSGVSCTEWEFGREKEQDDATD